MRYARRDIVGLSTPKEIIVKSLSDYLKLFASDKYTKYIYRGEPTNYLETVSSALRNGESPFINMKNEFKREIFHQLTTDEKNDFLAFAQHHGIPTNLIDFTRSPLVALYFACQPFISKDERLDRERGFIYLLENDLIDITDLLVNHEDENFLNRIIQSEEGILLKLYEKFVDYENHHPKTFHYYFKQLYDDWYFYFIDMQPLNRKRSRFPAYNNGGYKEKIKLNYIFKNTDITNTIMNRYREVNLEVLEYLLMLQEFLKKIFDEKVDVWWLNCMPNYLYTPFLTFERGRNQQGLFVYQAYLSFDEEHFFDVHILSQQRVWPEVIIVVENKERILKELDFLGINEKFIYGDYDSIAKYIKRKYENQH